MVEKCFDFPIADNKKQVWQSENKKQHLWKSENLKILKGTPEVFGGYGGSNAGHQLYICKPHAGVTFDQIIIFDED